MLNLYELEQLAAFARYGILSRTAEALHISQPTLTRTMQHLEEEFGVALFVHGKNRLALNETGKKAVEYASALLSEAEKVVAQVRQFDANLRTILVDPAPRHRSGACFRHLQSNFRTKQFLLGSQRFR